MNKYENREPWGWVAFEVVGSLIVIVLAGAYYFIPHEKSLETSPIKPLSGEMLVASSSIMSESDLVGKKEITVLATTTVTLNTTVVTAYIKNINGDKITLDYFDLLGGEEAKKAIVKDGRCTQKEVDENAGCFNNGIVYFRNQNPKLRILTLSPEIKIYRSTAFDKSADGTAEILLQELRRQYSGEVYSDLAKFVNLPYKITLNDKEEVVRIEEVFRP